ncbi:hypothetical protein Pmani_031129 [Petrolisthes manimaculis]|uniref:ETS domain-containing protein n=1 Tax=Petrolisthes manimaculis TaxID=1843537 RepID=A0AAE1NU98_9EUCA|nr:hypothetical protein Pmani_031129 [Petrolisthes manimaculis]
MDATKPCTDFMEPSLTMTESLQLPEGNNISRLCQTYLDPLDISTGSILEGEAVAECKQTRWKGDKSGKVMPSPVTTSSAGGGAAFGLNVSQWGERECEMWARAVCQSAGVDYNNTQQILRVFSSLNGTQLLQLREHQLSQLLGLQLASIFHLHIQNLKRSKLAKDIKKTHKSHTEAQSSDHYQYQAYNNNNNNNNNHNTNTLHQHLITPYDTNTLHQHHLPTPYDNSLLESNSFPLLDQYSQQQHQQQQPQQHWEYEHYDHQHYRPGQEEGITAIPSYHQVPGASSSTHPSLFQEDMWGLDEVDSSDLDRYLPEDGSSDPLAQDLQELDLETSLLVVKDEPTSSRSSSPSSVSIPVSPLPQRHTGALDKIPTKTRRKERGPKSWEFLMRLLVDPKTNPALVRWEDESEATFRLSQPSLVAQLWGARADKKDLSYVNFARGLRYHYISGALQPVSERQLVYRCGPSALNYLNELKLRS